MSRCFLGLISGTSYDAIDAAAIEIDDNGQIKLLGGIESPIPTGLRERLTELRQPTVDMDLLARIDTELAELFAETAIQCMHQLELAPIDVTAIGSHGQTLWHRPQAPHSNTLQIGNPAIIAARTGRPVVADFRRADMALGGQGAPLVPPFHRALFGIGDHKRAVLNLGGIANLTLLDGDSLLGFDTGPANALLDEWVQHSVQQSHDHDGHLARKGKVLNRVLDAWLDHPFFCLPAPKSTGREMFHLNALKPDPRTCGESASDVAATLTELTAASVARALGLIPSQQTPITQIIAVGGGTRNPFLMQRLAERIKPIELVAAEALGIDSELIEAAAFAWLAARRLDRLPGNVPSVTGARHECLLGAVYR